MDWWVRTRVSLVSVLSFAKGFSASEEGRQGEGGGGGEPSLWRVRSWNRELGTRLDS